jgi:chromosome segregation ATPase
MNRRMFENEKKQKAVSEILEFQDKKISDLFSSVILIRDEIGSSKEKIERITKDVLDEKKRMDEIYTNIQRLNEFEIKLNENVTSSKKTQEDVSKLHLDLDRINSEFLSIKNSTDSLNKQINSISNRVKDIESTVSEFTSLKETVNKKISENEKKQEAFAKIIETQDKKVLDLFSSINLVNNNINAIRTKGEEIERELSNEKERIDKLEQEIGKINEIEITLNKNVQDTFKVLKEVDFVNKRIDRALTNFDNSIASFVKRDEIDRIKDDLKNFSRNSDISALKNQIDSLTREKDMILNDLKNINKYLDETTGKIEKDKFETASTMNKINELNNRILDLANRMSLLKSNTEQIKELQSKTDQIEKRIDEVIGKSIDRMISAKILELNNKLSISMTNAMNDAALNLSSLQIWLILRNLHTLDDPRMITENLNSVESIIDFLKSRGLNTDEIRNSVINELFNLRREWAPFDESTAQLYETAIERLRLK